MRLSEQAFSAAPGVEEAHIELAGRPVLLRFAGDAMSESLMPALEHLRVQPTEPELTLRIWDSASTSTPAPVAPWGPEDFREQGTIRGFFGDGFYSVWELGPEALNVVDVDNGLAFFWLRSHETLGFPERSAPLRTLLNLWLIGDETQLVHGAAVGRPDGCVLLIGPSGAGKSSTALSCLDSGLGHIGEDYCLATRGDPPTVGSIYSSAKLAPGALSRLPGVEQLEAEPPNGNVEGKALIDLNAAMPQKLLRSAPLRAIAIPRISKRSATTTRRCGAGAALAAVAPSTLLQLPGDRKWTMRWLTELVTAVPCYELELGFQPELIPPVLEGLLDPS